MASYWTGGFASIRVIFVVVKPVVLAHESFTSVGTVRASEAMGIRNFGATSFAAVCYVTICVPPTSITAENTAVIWVTKACCAIAVQVISIPVGMKTAMLASRQSTLVHVEPTRLT